MLLVLNRRSQNDCPALFSGSVRQRADKRPRTPGIYRGGEGACCLSPEGVLGNALLFQSKEAIQFFPTALCGMSEPGGRQPLKTRKEKGMHLPSPGSRASHSMKKELSPRQVLAIRCPTCGAKAGEK